MRKPNPSIDEFTLFTPAQFGAWLGQSERWVKARRNTLPGTVEESREVWFIHPKTYLQKRLK